MARCAARDGITAIVCTPHMDTFGNTAVALSRHALVRKALQERLDGEGIPLHLYGGAEWMVSEELVNVLQDLPEGRLARVVRFYATCRYWKAAFCRAAQGADAVMGAS